MNRKTNARKTVIEYCRKLYDKGYLPGVDGNISMKVDDSTILITPSGVSKQIVTQDDLVLVNLSGKSIDEHKKPSVETAMHLAAYNGNSAINAVFHTHSSSVTAFALARKKIDTCCAPFAHYHLGIVDNVCYSPPGSDELHANAAASIKSGHITLLLESHGSLVLGTDMQDAFVKADLLENYADMLIKAKLLGDAHVLTDEEISEICVG